MQKLPEEFTARMRAQLGNEAEDFFLAMEEHSPTSIRLNHLKGKTDFRNLEQVPWCTEGFYLQSRPLFHLDPHWHGGAYYVQEAASMILDHVIGQIKPDAVSKIWVDMCAAPGGKTGILASHMNQGDVLLANEVVPLRRAVLRENLYKAGYLNTFITAEQPSAFREPFADIMLVDAPCAGEGMMRKEPEAIRQWSPGLVRECSIMQKRILHDAVRALRPGGFLIYSTCSYSAAENIENLNGLLQSFPLTSIVLQFPDEWNITTVEMNEATGYQLYPHKVKGEGLFIAVLKNVIADVQMKPLKKKHQRVFAPVPGWLLPYIISPEKWVFLKNSNSNSFISIDAEEKANEVLHNFPRAEFVAEAGLLKGKDFIPSHFLAMSGLASPSYPKVDIEMNLAHDYLERITTTLPSGQPQGWHLISFQNTILGWAKNTLQGWKNHYPLQWKLRSRKMSKD